MARSIKKAHCKNGHKYTKANTYLDAHGWRTCRACKKRYGRNGNTANKITIDMEIPTPPRPLQPTMAIPGTEAKVSVMESRVENGFQPHHPKDYREEKNPN